MERYSWAVGIDENTGLITVEDARLSLSALITPAGLITSRTGVIPTGAGAPGDVVATNPTPNGFVHSSPFRAVMQSERGGGTYVWCLDEVKSIDILGAAPADAANDRIDLIVWQQNDTHFLDAGSDFEVRHVVGDPLPVPVDPEVDGSEDYVVRARITVPAGATEITGADIEVLPLPWTVATGGVLPVRDQAERDAIGNPFDGMAIHRLDRGWDERHDGIAWRVQGTAICASTADRDAAITHPVEGQMALTTSTYRLWVWRSGSWAEYPGASVNNTQNTLGTTTSSAGWTSTLTGAGAAACGVVFVAPPSGRVLIANNCRISSTGPYAYCSVRMRTGGVIGSGSDIIADGIDHALINSGPIAIRAGTTRLVTGLTSGATYNVQQRFIVDGGTGTFESKHLAVSPA